MGTRFECDEDISAGGFFRPATALPFRHGVDRLAGSSRAMTRPSLTTTQPTEGFGATFP